MLVTDHLGRMVEVNLPAKRIVSLCPSITETLFALGAGSLVIGRTRFCIHPDPEVKSVLNVGGTKDVSYARISSLHPDLIIAEKEENTKEIVAALERDYPVFVGDVNTVSDAFRLIQDLGKLTGSNESATKLVESIQSGLPRHSMMPVLRYAYVIWKNPEMGVGKGTYIDDLMMQYGFYNVFSDLPDRYPHFSLQMLIERKPDVVFLSSEPYPFAESDRVFFATHLPHSVTLLIDGEVAWYGARMAKAVQVLHDARMAVER